MNDRVSVDALRRALNSWSSEVKEYLKKLDLLVIDISRVFNLDKSALFLVSKGDLVLARRESKTVYKVVHDDENESTVLFTVNAKDDEKAMKSNNVTVGYRKIEEEAPKLSDFKKSIE